MRVVRRHLLYFFAWLIYSTSPAYPQQPPRFTAQADYVRVPVSVFDSRGRLLLQLEREQFTLFDEGEPRQIDNFLLDESPIFVVLLLDVSGSVKDELEPITEAALGFARALSPNDRFSALAFSDEVVVLQEWTNDFRALRRSIRKLRPGYRTALYDALLSTAQEKLNRVSGKKAIILLTDGLDNESNSSHESVVSQLISSAVSVYVISRTRFVRSEVEKSERVAFLNRVMNDVLQEDSDFVEIYFREKESAMSQLAEATGGRALFPKGLDELKGTYLEVARELKNQYVLTFRPPQESKLEFRHIEVRCSEIDGRVSHRRQYHWTPQLSRPSSSR